MKRVERFVHNNVPYTLLEMSIDPRTSATVAIRDDDLDTVLKDNYLGKLDDEALFDELTEAKTGFTRLLLRTFGQRTTPYAFLHDRTDGTPAYRETQDILLDQTDGNTVTRTVPRTEQHYFMGNPHGEQKGWHSTGWPSYAATYDNGRCYGDACEYYKNGKTKTVWHYENGQPKAKHDENGLFPAFCYMGFDPDGTLIQAAFENKKEILHGKKLEKTIAKFQEEKGVIFTLQTAETGHSKVRHIVADRLSA